MSDDLAAASNATEGEAVSTQTQAPAAPASIRDALQGAFDKVNAAEGAGTTTDEAAKAADRARDDAGRFARAEAAKPADKAAPVTTEQPAVKVETPSAIQAPSRFAKEAREAWNTTPPAVQVEVDRAIRELSAGLEKYKGDAEAFVALKEYDQMARQSGRDLPSVLKDFVSTENMLRQDPVRGIMALCTQHLGIDPRQLGAALMGQQANVSQSAERQQIEALQREIASLKEGFTGVNTTLKQRQEAETARMVEDFSRDKPYFDDLADPIAALLTDGLEHDGAVYKAKTLQSAYKMAFDHAERFSPAVYAKMQAEKTAAKPTQPQPDQTRSKASISISGAPGGSDPHQKKAGGSIRDSLRDGFASAGLL